ncbi:50S ribosomal protein L29 [Sphingomonas sp. MMS24-JH45]
MAQSKNSSKKIDVAGQSDDQLSENLGQLKREQFNLRFQAATTGSRSRAACARSARTSPASRPAQAARAAAAK